MMIYYSSNGKLIQVFKISIVSGYKHVDVYIYMRICGFEVCVYVCV